MDSYGHALTTLQALLPLKEENIEAFEAAVVTVVETGGSRSVHALLVHLDDASPYTGTMEHIWNALEALPTSEVHRAFFSNFAEYFANSPAWVRRRVQGLLNSPNEHAALLAALHCVGREGRDDLLQIVAQIRARSPERYGEVCDAVTRQILESSEA